MVPHQGSTLRSYTRITLWSHPTLGSHPMLPPQGPTLGVTIGSYPKVLPQVPLWGPTIGFHYMVTPQSPILGPHPKAPPQGPTLASLALKSQSHHRVYSQAQHMVPPQGPTLVSVPPQVSTLKSHLRVPPEGRGPHFSGIRTACKKKSDTGISM